MANSPIDPEGSIRQENGSTIVEVQGSTHLATAAGVECINPTAAENQRIYRKVFTQKPIYLHDDYDRAVKENISGDNVVVIGMNGYSSISEKNCQEWGVKPGAYEAACAQLLRTCIGHLREQYEGIGIRVVHGASAMGVDDAVIKVGKAMKVPMLGHSCPRFMMYVEDDDVPVHVADTKAAYAEHFISSLDILIAANGREQAFRHDINAAFIHNKHVMPINVLRSISDRGGPPAFRPDGTIEDAVAAFEKRVHLVSQQLQGTELDPWKNILNHTQNTVGFICRSLLSPNIAFKK